VLSVVAGASESGFVEGPAANARFDYPRGGCADPRTGALYITDYGNHRVRIISPQGIVSSIGSGNKTCKDGSATIAAFNGPLDLCIGPHNTFYVCELGAVRIINGTSHEVTTYAGAETCGYLDGPRLSARFSGLTALAWRHDTMFLADFNNHLIRMISPTGIVSTFAGTTKGSLDGPARSAQFQFPWGLCLTNEGHLLISDSSNNKIRIMRNAIDPIELKEAKDFCSFESLHDASISTSSTNGSSSILYQPPISPLGLHSALAHLAYPSLVDIQPQDLSQHPDLLQALSALLYTNILPSDADPLHIINMIYLGSKLHLPSQFMPYLMSELSSILPRLPISRCMELLLHINDHCGGDEALIDLAIASIQPRLPSGNVPEACAPLLVNATFAVGIMTKLLNPKNIPLPDDVKAFPGWFIQEKLTALYWTCVATESDIYMGPSNLSVDKSVATSSNQTVTAGSTVKPSISPFPSALSCNFVISNSDRFEIKVHDWVLYARWPYFQHLVKSGFSEVTNGRLELPSEAFSSSQLRAFVRYMYTQEEAPYDTDDLKLDLLRNAPQFNLVDLSTPPVPNPHFKKLLAHCREVLNAPCTHLTCISQYKIMAEMGSSQQLNAVGRFILDNFNDLIRDPERTKELKSLGTRAFGEMWLRSRSCDPAEWKP
jgi:hypothetical protein